MTIIEKKVRGGFYRWGQIFYRQNRKRNGKKRGWQRGRFLSIFCGDAYVDHPYFGAAIICRTLEAKWFLRLLFFIATRLA